MGLQIHTYIEKARRKSGFASFLDFFSGSSGRMYLVCMAFSLLIVFNLPSFAGIDYFVNFRPATELLLHGQSPYSHIFNPPWVLLPYIPLSILPEMVAFKLWSIASAGFFLTALIRMKIRPLAILIFFLSPPVLFSLVCGNVEALVLLGFTLPPTWGLFLVLLKPQMGFTAAIFWAVDIFLRDGLKGVVKVFAPVSIAFLLSFLVFGYWPKPVSFMLDHARTTNISFFPLSLPLGLALLYLSLRKRNISLAMISSPMISPYSLLYAWAGTLAGLSHKWWLVLIGSLFFWIVYFLSYFQLV